jgi:hypothetical protein
MVDPAAASRRSDDLQIQPLIAPRPCAPFGVFLSSRQQRSVGHSLQLRMKKLFESQYSAVPLVAS